ncbi:hypothetical protein K2P56_03080 [Patescibacteria group bacterium]|nr:hypothetical protein [Patescibacteria group bacterium]
MILLIGTLGAGILLFFFSLLQFKILQSSSLWYIAGNFLGAVLLAYYAYAIESWPFLVIETLWALVSLWQFISRRK